LSTTTQRRSFSTSIISSNLNMRCTALLLAVSPLLANAFNVVVSNDDGWAEQNVRTFVKTLTTAGFAAVLSSPAENQSGTSSSDTPPKTVGSSGCQFGSCPAGSPATGFNASDTKLNVCLMV
jgi:5'/3'-nucleotidase SurE